MSVQVFAALKATGAAKVTLDSHFAVHKAQSTIRTYCRDRGMQIETKSTGLALYIRRKQCK